MNNPLSYSSVKLDLYSREGAPLKQASGFIVEADGRVVLRPRNRKAVSFAGILQRPGQKVATLEDMERGIAEAVTKRHERSGAGD